MKSNWKNRKRYLLIVGLLLLVGCSNAEQEAYNEAIQKGLDILSAEQYKKAEAYFEIALENQPDDEKATAYLAQTQIFREAKDFYESKEYAEALEKAQQVVDSENGLEGLIAKATTIIEAIDTEVTVDITPVSKIDLYNRYMGAKGSYDAALINVIESPEMTMAQYEKLRSYIQ